MRFFGRDATPRIKPLVKPRLRGVSHEVAFYVSLLTGAWLFTAAPSGDATIAVLVYALSVSALFGISALYHRPHWSPASRARMRRLDHAAIFVLIAGTFTPISLLGMHGSLLIPVWAGAALGVAKSVLWTDPPRWLNAALYVALGWFVLFDWSGLAAGVGEFGVAMLLTGGALYSTGAVVYAARRPDPRPALFGYHEIFHLFVVAAAACHFLAVSSVVLSPA